MGNIEDIAARRREYIRSRKELRFFERIELDLGDARDKEEHQISGDTILVESIDGEVDLYFNEPESDYVELDRTRKLYMDYWRIYITNAAQTGKSCTIIAGRQGTFDGISDVARESKQGNTITVSDKVLVSDDPVESVTDETWTKAKEFLIKITGNYRCKWWGHGTAANGGYMRIYKDGVAYGTTFTHTAGQGTTWVERTDDLFFEAGELCQLYHKDGPGGNFQVKEFDLCGTLGFVAAEAIEV